MDVSIIIVNYNTKNLLADCLDSIYQETKHIDFEIIVVDNDSKDGSESYIKSLYPNIIWINSGVNLGFGKANNLGAKYANGNFLLFLNSDTILLNNAVEEFVKYIKLNNDKKIGALGGWLLDKNEKLNNSYGFFPSINNEIKYLLGRYNKSKDSKILREKEVDYIIGADLFIEKKIFNKLGGFDSNIFMYYEETDLQYRLSILGLRRLIISGPQIIHLEGGSFKKSGLSYNRFIMAQTSYNYYLYKHFFGFSFLYTKIILILVRLTIFMNKEWTFKEKCKAFRVVLKIK